MIAFLVIVYTGVVLVLFKVFHLKPTPYLIASMIVAGVLMIGGVVVWWTQSAPLTAQLVTTQYVVQLVPYVKGQVKAVHAEANQPTSAFIASRIVCGRPTGRPRGRVTRGRLLARVSRSVPDLLGDLI